MNLTRTLFGRSWTSQQRNTMWGYFFLTPTILGLLVFWAFPMLYSLGLSLTEWNILSPPRFVGVQNYVEMASDALVQKSLTVTLYYTAISVPAINIVTLFLASLLNSKVKGLSFYRTAIYLPSIVPMVAAAALWMFILNPMSGLANTY